jgi:hypothetical protein
MLEQYSTVLWPALKHHFVQRMFVSYLHRPCTTSFIISGCVTSPLRVAILKLLRNRQQQVWLDAVGGLQQS